MAQAPHSEEVRFERLYQDHYARVYGLCRQMLRAPHEAEDATQEAFLRAYRARARYDPGRPFAGWILNIAARHCVDVLRRRSKERQLFADVPSAESDAEADAAEALATLIAAERADAVQRAVAALPDRYRVPLLLAFYAEASYEEIAELLGITRNHVGVLLLRAKRAVGAALEAAHAETQS